MTVRNIIDFDPTDPLSKGLVSYIPCNEGKGHLVKDIISHSINPIDVNYVTPPPFTPTDLSNMFFWIRADNALKTGEVVPLSGELVSGILDSGLNPAGRTLYNWKETTPGFSPVYATNVEVFNDQPSFRFSGQNDRDEFLLVDGTQKPSTGNDVAIFIVFNSTGDLSPNAALFGQDSSDFLSISSSNRIQWHYQEVQGAVDHFFDFDTMVADQSNILCLARTGCSSVAPFGIGAITGWLNGTGSTLVTNAFDSSGSMDYTRVGARGGTSTTFNGYIPEWLVYTGTLSLTNIDSVGNYLSTRYNIVWEDVV